MIVLNIQSFLVFYFIMKLGYNLPINKGNELIFRKSPQEHGTEDL